MCGIAGYWGKKQLSQDDINETLSLMFNRGPDQQNAIKIEVTAEHKCYFLHSRLNIIDPTNRANQPFTYRDKTLIFNGEIYNYLEIKAELVKLGHEFTTSSDTEVLIHALAEWKDKALNKINGMWSLAYYDGKEKQLMLSRDLFGEKPLYLLADNEGGYYFGSEIKYVLSLSKIIPIPNYNQIKRFLTNGYRSVFKKNETFYQNIIPLRPARYLKINIKNRVNEVRYWVPRINQNNELSNEDVIMGAKERILESIRLRLRSDTPIAFNLSGGIDSTSIVCSARKYFDYEINAFSIVNSDERYDERDMIDAVCSSYEIKSHKIPLEKENSLENLMSSVQYHDAPVLTISQYLHWLLQRSIKENGFRISIGGSGADEIFSGYYDHFLYHLYDSRNNDTRLLKNYSDWNNHLNDVIRNPTLKNAYRNIQDPFDRSNIYFKNSHYQDFLLDSWEEDFDETFFPTKSLLQQRMLNEISHETVPMFLHDEDLNAMFFSIENRSPFLDRELVEYCYSIPPEKLINNGKAKFILREAMRDTVPDTIIDNRRKVGFNAPISDLLAIENKTIKEYILAESEIYQIINRKSIEKILGYQSIPNSDSKFLFSFLTSKIFLDSKFNFS